MLNSSLSATEAIRAKQSIKSGQADIVYIAPERLLLESSLELFKDSNNLYDTQYSVDENNDIYIKVFFNYINLSSVTNQIESLINNYKKLHFSFSQNKINNNVVIISQNNNYEEYDFLPNNNNLNISLTK